jgi:hypothetical protein
MKRRLAITLAAMTLLLTGCATTIRSNVVSYSQWPADTADKTFVFTVPQHDSVEYRTVENLVRQQLNRIGMRDADAAGAKYHVAVDLKVAARDVRVVSPVMVDPFWASSYYGWYSPRARFHHRGFYPYGFAPWPGPVVGYQEQVTTQVQRQLHVTISQAAGGQKVYDVLVENASRTADPMKVLPAMAVSAFEGFPGQNGVLRRVDVKTDE